MEKNQTNKQIFTPLCQLGPGLHFPTQNQTNATNVITHVCGQVFESSVENTQKLGAKISDAIEFWCAKVVSKFFYIITIRVNAAHH